MVSNMEERGPRSQRRSGLRPEHGHVEAKRRASVLLVGRIGASYLKSEAMNLKPPRQEALVSTGLRACAGGCISPISKRFSLP